MEASKALAAEEHASIQKKLDDVLRLNMELETRYKNLQNEVQKSIQERTIDIERFSQDLVEREAVILTLKSEAKSKDDEIMRLMAVQDSIKAQE